MKDRLYLINKETGYVITCEDKNEYANVITALGDDWHECYVSLLDHIEPLIDGHKRCEAVRVWAEANNITEVKYDKDKDCIYTPTGSDDTDTSISISFDNYNAFNKLEHRKLYSIDELCGK